MTAPSKSLEMVACRPATRRTRWRCRARWGRRRPSWRAARAWRRRAEEETWVWVP